MSIEQFYLREECLPFIYKLGENMVWGSESLDRIKIKEFDSETMTMKTEINSMDLLVKKTVSSLFGTSEIKKNIIYLVKSIKTMKQQVQLLAFYSKCIPEKSQRILSEVAREIQLEEGT
jgi:hypothetical protein